MESTLKFTFLVLLVAEQFIANGLAERVLRYTKDSCNSLEPVYVKETYNKFNLGMKEEEDSDYLSDEIDESPKKSNSRNPPFEVNIKFDQYRRNRDYVVDIIAEKEKYFDAFMIQARGKDADDGNSTFVGQWIKTPNVAKTIACLRHRRAAVVDVGRPIQFGNLTFVWRSPKDDKGPVKFSTSIVYKGQFMIIEAKINGSRIKNGGEVPYRAFPMALEGCGKDKGCFRYCTTRPKCPAEEARYMLTIQTEKSNEKLDSNELLIQIGGYLKDTKMNYIGVGFSRDNYRMRDSDVVACVRDGSRIQGERYLLEDFNSVPHRHKLQVRLNGAGVDSETGFTWCSFIRNIAPQDTYDLDLRRHFYQIYLWGEWNVTSSRPMMPKKSRILNSGVKLNASEPYSEIIFTGGHSLGSNRLSQNELLSYGAFLLYLALAHL